MSLAKIARAEHSPAAKLSHRTRALDQANRALLYSAMLAGGLVMFVPLAWVLLTSFKMPPEVTRIPITWLPDNPFYIDNYTQLFRVQPFGRYFLNSVIVTLISLVSSGALACLAAYAFAKIEFRFKELFFILALAVFMVPLEAVVLPLYLMVSTAGLLNTYLGMALPDLFTAFGVFLLRQFMEGFRTTILMRRGLTGHPNSEFFGGW